MRLVDHEQAGGGGEFGQYLIAEVGIVEPLRADQQDVDLPGGDLGLDGVPLLGVGRVDRPGPDTGAVGGVDLVAHEGEQWGDDHGRTAAAFAEQGRGHEVDGGFAPARALDDQGPAALGHQCLDRAPLVLAQAGFARRVPDEPG